jgi:hypothetical protein
MICLALQLVSMTFIIDLLGHIRNVDTGTVDRYIGEAEDSAKRRDLAVFLQRIQRGNQIVRFEAGIILAIGFLAFVQLVTASISLHYHAPRSTQQARLDVHSQSAGDGRAHECKPL